MKRVSLKTIGYTFFTYITAMAESATLRNRSPWCRQAHLILSWPKACSTVDLVRQWALLYLGNASEIAVERSPMYPVLSMARYQTTTVFSFALPVPDRVILRCVLFYVARGNIDKIEPLVPTFLRPQSPDDRRGSAGRFCWGRRCRPAKRLRQPAPACSSQAWHAKENHIIRIKL